MCVLFLSLICALVVLIYPQIFSSLWKLLESDNSYMARICVSLLLECQHHLATLEVGNSSLLRLPNSTLWKILDDGFKSSKWKTLFRTGEKFNGAQRVRRTGERGRRIRRIRKKKIRMKLYVCEGEKYLYECILHI